MNLDATGQALGHREAQGMFSLLLDEELQRPDENALFDHLSGCVSCKTHLEKYARAVSLVRNVRRERAPADFTAQILKRVRKRRRRALFDLQGGRMFEHMSIPAEAALPVIIAAAVAAVLIFASP